MMKVYSEENNVPLGRRCLDGLRSIASKVTVQSNQATGNINTSHVNPKLARTLRTQCDLMRIWDVDHGRSFARGILPKATPTTLARFLKRTLIRLALIVEGKCVHTILLEYS